MTANDNCVFTTIGASNHAKEERESHDYYATEPKAVELLLEKEQFRHYVWEPACGQGHMSEVLKQAGYNVKSSDLINRGYPSTEIIDFFNTSATDLDRPRDIITNPPYSKGLEFVSHALSLVPIDGKVAMFLKLQFLEGKARRAFFDYYPPKKIYVSSSRLLCAKNGDFKKASKQGSAVAYAWYVWQRGSSTKPVIEWIN